MNYTKIYECLVSKAKLENRKKGGASIYERHHIIPSCMGGSDLPENLVLLTPREHFVCHRLLVKIYPSHIGVNNALWIMINTRADVKNSNQYNTCKRRVVERMVLHNPMFNESYKQKHKETMQIVMQNGFIPYLATEEGRLKSSIRMNSDQHPMKNPIIAAKKVQTDIDRGNESWMTTDRGKEYFREKFKSDQHPLRLKPWNARTAFEVEVELVNGDILHYKMLKEFYDSYGINKDVAAKIIKTGIIPTKHQKKFKRICKRDSSTSAT